MKKYTSRKIGDIGEDFAEKYLIDKGYRTLTRNYTKSCGELDIISQYENFIVFIEVKTRKQNSMTLPCEAVTKAKANRLFKTAFLYIQENSIRLQPRFDVIEVTLDTEKMTVTNINHIENALWQEGDYAVF